jgi:hypothetical protein
MNGESDACDVLTSDVEHDIKQARGCDQHFRVRPCCGESSMKRLLIYLNEARSWEDSPPNDAKGQTKPLPPEV